MARCYGWRAFIVPCTDTLGYVVSKGTAERVIILEVYKTMVTMTCINLDLKYKFNIRCESTRAKFLLKRYLYSPTIRCIGYKNESPVWDNDLEYWFSQQVQYILPVLEYVKQFPFYVKEIRY